MCTPVPWGLDSLPESQEKLKELPAMEDPGETGAHPLGATSLNFVPGHQQKEKLVKLGGPARCRAACEGEAASEGS